MPVGTLAAPGLLMKFADQVQQSGPSGRLRPPASCRDNGRRGADEGALCLSGVGAGHTFMKPQRNRIPTRTSTRPPPFSASAPCPYNPGWGVGNAHYETPTESQPEEDKHKAPTSALPIPCPYSVGNGGRGSASTDQ